MVDATFHRSCDSTAAARSSTCTAGVGVATPSASANTTPPRRGRRRIQANDAGVVRDAGPQRCQRASPASRAPSRSRRFRAHFPEPRPVTVVVSCFRASAFRVAPTCCRRPHTRRRARTRGTANGPGATTRVLLVERTCECGDRVGRSGKSSVAGSCSRTTRARRSRARMVELGKEKAKAEHGRDGLTSVAPASRLPRGLSNRVGSHAKTSRHARTARLFVRACRCVRRGELRLPRGCLARAPCRLTRRAVLRELDASAAGGAGAEPTRRSVRVRAMLTRVQSHGCRPWIDAQLHPERIDDSATDSVPRALSHAVAELRGASTSSSLPPRCFAPLARRDSMQRSGRTTLADSLQLLQQARRSNQFVAELTSSRVARAVMSERQLQEVMVDFWENHFTVFAGKGQTRWYLTSYDRDVIRPNALGHFRDLLGAVAKSPAMLFYLDNAQSVADSGRSTLRPPRGGNRAAGTGNRGRAGRGTRRRGQQAAGKSVPGSRSRCRLRRAGPVASTRITRASSWSCTRSASMAGTRRRTSSRSHARSPDGASALLASSLDARRRTRVSVGFARTHAGHRCRRRVRLPPRGARRRGKGRPRPQAESGPRHRGRRGSARHPRAASRPPRSSLRGSSRFAS